MADILQFIARAAVADESAAVDRDVSEADERFLVDEGLDLLKAFRGISDAAMRGRVRVVVEQLAALDALTKPLGRR